VKSAEEKVASEAAKKAAAPKTARKTPAVRAPKKPTSTKIKEETPLVAATASVLPVAAGSATDRTVPASLEMTLQNLAIGEKGVQLEKPDQASKENENLNAFESDPLSNPALSWGAPQNNLQWATPITLESNVRGKTASPVVSATPEVLQQHKEPLVAELQPQIVSQHPQVAPQPHQEAPQQPQIASQQHQVAQQQPQIAPQQPQPPLTPRKAPVFTSSGFIPFASSADIPIASIEQPSGSSTVGSGDDNFSGTTQEGDIWDVPFTPTK
jgi:hypothetical protein